MSEENYSKLSCDCRRLPGDTFPKDSELRVGDFIWGKPEADNHRTLYIIMPGRDAARLRPDAIHVCLGSSPGARIWAWDGNEDKPTLQPSLHWVGDWHGFLLGGQLKSC